VKRQATAHHSYLLYSVTLQATRGHCRLLLPWLLLLLVMHGMQLVRLPQLPLLLLWLLRPLP
jgi:hypothetical protein